MGHKCITFGKIGYQEAKKKSLGIGFALNFAKIAFLKKTIWHITIYLLTAVILVASTGFSVCCLFGCHSQEVRAGQLDCCEKTVCGPEKEHPGKGCDGCQSTYISLDADWLATSFETLAAITFQVNNLCTAHQMPLYIPKKVMLFWENDLPPPPYGKALLPFIQSFLC